MKKVSDARLVAYDVLRDVDERDAYANLALVSRIRTAQLDPRDAALATELTAGTLRGRGRYDSIIELAANRPISDIDGRTKNVLRLGTHQILSMRTAAHAAVNESVELQRLVSSEKAVGFVNGVLRTIGRASNEEWNERLNAAAGNSDQALAATSSHPAWVIRALRSSLRADGDEHGLDDLLLAHNTPAKVSLAVLPSSGIDAEDAAKRIDELDRASATVTGPSPLGVELVGGDPGRVIDSLGLPPGTVRVQDQGSQLAALMLTRVTPVRPGEVWLDLCAGPGGKTAVLGAEAQALSTTVRANEVSEHRADLVCTAAIAANDVVDIVSHDGREDAAYGGPHELFDRILVDAPCSGLGALRRRPEARWRKQPSDLSVLTVLQGELIDAAVAHLAPGGVLAYVTCSPHLAETRVTVDASLKRHPALVELNAQQVLCDLYRGELELTNPEALSVQLWPHRHGTDAMFIALLTNTQMRGVTADDQTQL